MDFQISKNPDHIFQMLIHKKNDLENQHEFLSDCLIEFLVLAVAFLIDLSEKQ